MRYIRSISSDTGAFEADHVPGSSERRYGKSNHGKRIRNISDGTYDSQHLCKTVYRKGSLLHMASGNHSSHHSDHILYGEVCSETSDAESICKLLYCICRNCCSGCSAPKYNVANLHAGCVELFVGKNARLRYSTIENWSKNMYNLNTKRALVEEGGTIEWVSGSFGSHVSYLYPMSILKGRDSKMEFTGITFAGKGQNLDTGAKVVHIGENTSSYINTKSISKDGGISTFRSSVVVNKGAENAKSSVSCQSLMLDSESRSDTIPAMDIRTKNANVGHEAQIGSISDEAVFYLMSRGMSEEDARACIVSGFADNVSKELPLEYALEMNNLIRLEMKGSIG